MSDRVIVTRSLLENVASSIRKKTNTDKTLTLKGMAEAVDGMEYPPSYDGEYTITENGTYKTGGKKMESDLTVNVAASSSKNTLKTLLGATKSCYYLFYNYRGTSVDDLISYEDTSNVTNMSNMFYGCYNLTEIPLLNTSNVTNMNYMFYYGYNLTEIPLLNTSNVTNMSYMFYSCYGLTTIPLLNTSNVTNMSNMFDSCYGLTTIPLLNTSNVTNMSNMFYGCYNLTTIPSLDTSNVTNMSNMFYYCQNLTTIPLLNTSNVKYMSRMFDSCSKLTEIHMTGMKVDFDIHYSTEFTREALLEIINNCQDLTGKTSHKITMGSTNLAKLTDEDKLIATNKNWTLA